MTCEKPKTGFFQKNPHTLHFFWNNPLNIITVQSNSKNKILSHQKSGRPKVQSQIDTFVQSVGLSNKDEKYQKVALFTENGYVK